MQDCSARVSIAAVRSLSVLSRPSVTSTRTSPQECCTPASHVLPITKPVYQRLLSTVAIASKLGTDANMPE